MEIATPETTVSYEFLWEFPIEEKEFSIYCDRETKVWTVHAYDEDQFDDDIVIQDPDNPLITDMLLFNGFVLTPAYLHKLEKMINEQNS